MYYFQSICHFIKMKEKPKFPTIRMPKQENGLIKTMSIKYMTKLIKTTPKS